MRRQRLLPQHLPDLRARTQPAPTVIHRINPIELLDGTLIRRLIIAQHARRVADVVDAAKFRHAAVDEGLDGGGLGDVGGDGEDCGGRGDGGDEGGGFVQAGAVQVGEDEFRAAFAGEGDGGRLADAWGSISFFLSVGIDWMVYGVGSEQ